MCEQEPQFALLIYCSDGTKFPKFSHFKRLPSHCGYIYHLHVVFSISAFFFSLLFFGFFFFFSFYSLNLHIQADFSGEGVKRR